MVEKEKTENCCCSNVHLLLCYPVTCKKTCPFSIPTYSLQPGRKHISDDIRNQSHDYPHKVAKYTENRNRNRYRDVSPYDHSRVILQNTDNDYINASMVVNEEAQRNYIVTQGPLPNTCCHFWLMVWQQKTKAVVMLNRIVEKDSVKCAQYWPAKQEELMMFSETGFCVRLKSEDVKSYYTVRQLQLENTNIHESRIIFHFHYTTWPDFGVPESPASFLNYLFKVRESGSLNPEHGPAVIHCSAGIGRSGTFLLVDTCLVLMEKREDPFSVDIKQVLLNMRKYRMGLIQTPDQLRFSYMAVIEGAKYIMGDSTIQNRWKELSKEDQASSSGHSPPNLTKQPTKKYNGSSVGLENQEQTEDIIDAELSSTVQNTADTNADIAFRKRLREDRKANTAQMVQQMKHKLSEVEKKRKRWLYWKPILFKIGFGTAIFIGIYTCWKLYLKDTPAESDRHLNLQDL
ncbi:tyrosine-protein phosphatase non-receptor type 2 isoform X3 [Hemicordylus capensis]|uniref:tyrosine-protein phosphatase non-receptor type 2 isoform X3 n=1 Tax=Hemicordylus capensis TaxID=884348 RepID=UPI0023021952|nr:tyrosine-protein phosphatase non-receptor type 2 isoform X3 [Hemicordylus capensis]